VGGGFAELVVSPQRNCMKLDEAIDYEVGCLLFDNFGTPFAALDRASVGVGDEVLVMGCGPIGLASVILAKQRGAFVIAADPLAYRRLAAARFGADATLSPDDEMQEAVKFLTSGLGVRVAIECSGQPPAYPMAMASLRIGGALVLAADRRCFGDRGGAR
jgi:threonine dehydrogenase-like Zn-dependent dehydrogenase